MRTDTNRWIWGVLLVGLGVLFLLDNLGLRIAGTLWGLLFLAGGGVFLWMYRQNSAQWWPLIPGFTLAALGLLILFGNQLGEAGGALFLGGIGLGFLMVYLSNRSNWWAVIPGGTLLTLAVVAWMGDRGDAGGSVFFLGLALTFGAVFLLGQRWGIFPAAACLVLALVVSEAFRWLLTYVGPLALIGLGVWFLLRNREREVSK